MSSTEFKFRRVGSAFTLVELLVVVAIIALLVSILLPTLGRAKEQARIVSCMSNLRSLGLSYVFYTNENNDWYPGSAGYGGDPPTWDDRLWPYYENYGLLVCPSDKLERPVWVEHNRSYASNINVAYRGPSEYGENLDPKYNGETPYTSDGSIWKSTDVEVPADTILLGDMWESWYYGDAPTAGGYNRYVGSGIFDGMWSGAVPVEPPSRSPTPYHRDMDAYNFLFCDNHVLTLPKGHRNLIDIDGDGSNDPEDMYYYKREKYSIDGTK
ncbi:MAG: type II secretion system protein [Planctomycetota bacterium]|nr:type II secretion system protein [Planctomycetota bacterium]